MRKGRLKKLRIFLSLLFFTVIAVLFIDFTGMIYGSASHAVLHFQFIPSVIMFVATGTAAAIGFLFIIILTLLFGRLYCSTLCPLGTLQDLFSFAARKLSPRKIIYKFKKPVNWLRYGLTAVVILSLLTGSILMVNLQRLRENFPQPVQPAGGFSQQYCIKGLNLCRCLLASGRQMGGG
jgi:polyferredoxin